MHSILKEIISLFQQYEKIHIQTFFVPVQLIVHADREELKRALMNILRNAVQAMNEEGTIRLTTSSEDHHVVIRITDSGPGIPDAILSRLFEPNFSTKTEGMGLGLAIVKKTIDDLKGAITIESVLGQGTAVIIKLPVQRENRNDS